MKKLIFLFLPFLFITCSKDEPVISEATVVAICNSTVRYEITVDNVFQFNLEGGAQKEITLESGTYNLKAEQLEGFIFSPTIVRETVTLTKDEVFVWEFPF